MTVMRRYPIIVVTMALFFCQGAWAMPHDRTATCYTFGDRVNVRERPDTKARALATLPAGTEIRVLRKDDRAETIGGYADYWCHVSFRAEKGSAEGYVWGGLLSNQHFTMDVDLDGAVDLVLVRNHTEGVYSHAPAELKNPAGNRKALAMRIISKGKPIREIDLDANGESGPVKMRVIRPEGLDGGPSLLAVSYDFTDELSGRTDILFLLKETGPERVMTYLSGGEGGYVATHTFVMPRDRGGKRNTIIVNRVEEDAGEKPKRTSIEYRWDAASGKFVKN